MKFYDKNDQDPCQWEWYGRKARRRIPNPSLYRNDDYARARLDMQDKENARLRELEGKKIGFGGKWPERRSLLNLSVVSGLGMKARSIAQLEQFSCLESTR